MRHRLFEEGGADAGRTISIGAQGFAGLRERDNFLVDKTDFIRQWWTSDDQVTLICRPRRFGKTLNMSMLECFFSQAYAFKLQERGVHAEHIRCYGFAFQGKRVLIG